MNSTLVIGSLLMIGVIVLVAYVAGVYNMLVRLANNIDKAWSNIDDKAQAENQIVGALGKLFAVAEQYPDLKANQEFLAVQQRISALESTIADRREFYNDSVNLYNIAIQQIPTFWVAQEVGYTARPLLTVAPSDRKDVPLAFANRTTVAA